MRNIDGGEKKKENTQENIVEHSGPLTLHIGPKQGVIWTYKCAISSVFELEKRYLHQNGVEFDEELNGMPYYDLWTRF